MKTGVIILLGRPKAGKSTASKIINDATGRGFGSCSDVIYEVLATTLDTTEEELRQRPKEEVRPQLIRLGDALGRLRASIMPEVLLSRDKTIIDGVRKVSELLAFRNVVTNKGLKPLTIWVHRDDIPDIQDNTEVRSTHADLILHNNSSIEEFRVSLTNLLREIGWL